MNEESSASTSREISLIGEYRAVEEDFIKAYKNLPELWDTDHKHYTNKYKRSEALDVLLPIMRRWNPSANRTNVRQKINVLRSTYRKDLLKHLASKCIGENGEEMYEYEPRNWKFHALRFLEKNKDNQIAEINMDDNNFEDESSNGSESEKIETPRNSDVLINSVNSVTLINEDEPPRKRFMAKKKKVNKIVKEEIEDDYYEHNDNLLERELEAIGANVTCKLSRMNALQRYHAELLINKVLIYGLKNSLSDDTDLTDVYRP